MAARDYYKRIAALDSAWTFADPTKPAAYDPSIKT